MVLVDGKASRACLLNTAKLDGKKVLTVEELSAREKEVHAWSFASAGAVQCGFCMPGMVISAKGILDVNPDPRPEDITKALAMGERSFQYVCSASINDRRVQTRSAGDMWLSSLRAASSGSTPGPSRMMPKLIHEVTSSYVTSAWSGPVQFP